MFLLPSASLDLEVPKAKKSGLNRYPSQRGSPLTLILQVK